MEEANLGPKIPKNTDTQQRDEEHALLMKEHDLRMKVAGPAQCLKDALDDLISQNAGVVTEEVRHNLSKTGNSTFSSVWITGENGLRIFIQREVPNLDRPRESAEQDYEIHVMGLSPFQRLPDKPMGPGVKFNTTFRAHSYITTGRVSDYGHAFVERDTWASEDRMITQDKFEQGHDNVEEIEWLTGQIRNPKEVSKR